MKKRSRIVIQPKNNSGKKSKISIDQAAKKAPMNRIKTIGRQFIQNRLYFLSIVIFLAFICLFLFLCTRNIETVDTLIETSTTTLTKPKTYFLIPGLDTSQLVYKYSVLNEDKSIRPYLIEVGVKPFAASELKRLAQIKGLNTFKKEHDFYLFTHKNNHSKKYLYEIDETSFALLEIDPEIQVSIHDRPLQIIRKGVAGIIKKGLWSSLEGKGVRSEILDQMEGALKWSVDFHHLKPNDRYKIVYEEKWSDNVFIDIRLLAVQFESGDKIHYAFYVDDISSQGYYNKIGKTVEQNFLMSPIKYGRISSPFNLERLHPVLNKKIPHLGTDYAAPEGTPVRAVADGIISVASKTKKNGNFIKIKHDSVYETQYLHLQKFAAGMVKGRRVNQGDTIGYVGQTGLATGPHVCFRFWKNKKQVNHLEENINTSKPISIREESRFINQRDSAMITFLGMDYK